MPSFNATLVVSRPTVRARLHVLNTAVGTRALRPDQTWFEGHGRGYVREFISTEGTQRCASCNKRHPLSAFPTFSVPRADGRTRGTVCRAAVRAERVERLKKERIAASCAKARAAKAAKATTRKVTVAA